MRNQHFFNKSMTDETMNAEDDCSLDQTSAPFLYTRNISQETKTEMNEEDINIVTSDDESSLQIAKLPSYQINCALQRYHQTNSPNVNENRDFRTVSDSLI